MNGRNLGKFTMSEEIVRHDPEKALSILTLLKFVPLRAEFLAYDRTVEYIGMSPKFPEIREGLMVPEYKLVVSQGEDKEIVQVEVDKY